MKRRTPLPPVDVYENWIGQKVRKASGRSNQLSSKPFKSGNKANTVKEIVNHPQFQLLNVEGVCCHNWARGFAKLLADLTNYASHNFLKRRSAHASYTKT